VLPLSHTKKVALLYLASDAYLMVDVHELFSRKLSFLNTYVLVMVSPVFIG
jgi:hypothetical protein